MNEYLYIILSSVSIGLFVTTVALIALEIESIMRKRKKIEREQKSVVKASNRRKNSW